jgi:hypothetical protein
VRWTQKGAEARIAAQRWLLVIKLEISWEASKNIHVFVRLFPPTFQKVAFGYLGTIFKFS